MRREMYDRTYDEVYNVWVDYRDGVHDWHYFLLVQRG